MLKTFPARVLIAALLLLGAPFAALAAPELRGMNVPVSLNEEGVKTLASWNVNFVRFQLAMGEFGADVATSDEYFEWLLKTLDHLDTLLPSLQANGIQVLLDLHTPPGGFASKEFPPQFRVFTEQWAADALLETWGVIAMRYAGNPAIWGFELLSEPATGSTKPSPQYYELAANLALLVLTIDPSRRIIVAPDYANFKRLRPLANTLRKTLGKDLYQSNIIHTVHLFSPDKYVKQGLSYEKEIKYPSKAANKRKVRKMLRKVKKQQRKAKAKRLLIGEFSVVRWAPGGDQYLKDVMTFFERFGWDYAYHIFREADVWSVEHPSDRTISERSPSETERATVLKQFFARNVR